MGKKSWKLVLTAVLIIIAVWELWPPQKTLKLGLDLAGGTSLIYEIDTQGLDSGEKRGLAQRVIDILRRRIDPGNVQNLVWRPQGNTRIEVQIPLASAEAREKRKSYEASLEALQAKNINLALVMRSLGKGVQQRSEYFEQLARGSDERAVILNNLAAVYDQRKALQGKRDLLTEQLKAEKDYLQRTGLEVDRLKSRAAGWIKLDEQKRKEALADYAAGDDKKLALLDEYLSTYAQWAEVLDDLTDPEVGKNAEWKKAKAGLENLNLSIAQMTDVLEMPPNSLQRRRFIEEFSLVFPDRAEQIDSLVAAFNEYRTVRGRLDGPEDFKRMVKGAGVLEFRILPTLNDNQINTDQISSYIEALKTKGPKRASDDKYIWAQIENIEEWNVQSSIAADFGEKYYVLASNKADEAMVRGSGHKEWKLKKAYPDSDRMGRRAIGFTLDEVAGNLFFNITRNNTGRPLGIFLDGVAISAPAIKAAIRTSGVIEGQFAAIEVDDMVNKLNAGSLPARLIEPPVLEKTIGASIGADNRDQGIKAGLIGLGIVAVFMLIYYVGSGSIADVALFMNLLFVLAIMALSRATFTLPGIAGVILTIGMAVDANVLIFERIREEQRRGSSLRISVRNGYQRAFRTIFDANLTTFITALILYMVASEEIKGFAITLMIGIISSMFTALFVTRAIFEFLLAKKVIKEHLIMLRLIRNPQFDWMGARKFFLVLSVLLIGGSLYVFYTRDDTKNNKYDIEFTGGTSVQINLKQDIQLTRADVEKRIRQVGSQLNNARIAAARIYSVGTTERRYEINTTETNKITTVITFAQQTGQTVESITAAIKEAQRRYQGQLSNLVVTQDTPDSTKFIVSTSQVNKPLVKDILLSVFGPQADISEPQADAIVNRAVREAFAGQLEILENLGAHIVSSEKITDTVIDTYPEITDFLGGVQIVCNLKRPATAEQIQTRLKDLRFKPDMQNLAWHRFEILSSDFRLLEPNSLVSSFVYVSVEPEAGFRQLSQDEWDQFVANEKTKVMAAISLETSLPRITQIDPSIGKQAKTRALVAIILSLCAIIGYIWIRFGTARYGIAAIVALVHDVCITLGAIVACTYLAGTTLGEKLLIGDFKINLEMVAAFLTIIGYSLNDTIVVFDRIRENRGKLATLTPQIISRSINQTLSRTLLTSFTTFVVVLVMYIAGGSGLRGFTFAMLVGIIAGTYSSIAIAAPMLLIAKKKG